MFRALAPVSRCAPLLGRRPLATGPAASTNKISGEIYFVVYVFACKARGGLTSRPSPTYLELALALPLNYCTHPRTISPDELLEKLGGLSTQGEYRSIAKSGKSNLTPSLVAALVDGLWVMGWPCSQITGSRPLHPSHKTVGRAVTLR